LAGLALALVFGELGLVVGWRNDQLREQGAMWLVGVVGKASSKQQLSCGGGGPEAIIPDASE
jgi:hypothetical protein